MVTPNPDYADPAELERAIVSRSPGAWFELHGTISDKDKRLISAPELILNAMQQELDAIIVWCEENERPCRIVTLKGRQQGSSTWSTGALYHQCRKKRTRACIIGDSYEDSVASLVEMFDLFCESDRFDWGSTYHRPSGKFSHGSQFITQTANKPGAGRGKTIQSLLCTEVAWWKKSQLINPQSVFRSLMNCVPKRPGTLVIVESTPNGEGGVYHETYAGAISFVDLKAGKIPKDWNGFIKVFYPWHKHPEYRKALGPVSNEKTYTQAEADEIMGALTDKEQGLVDQFGLDVRHLSWRRMKIADPEFNGDEDMFEQEYPKDEESCFLASNRRAFPVEPLKAMVAKAEREGPGMLKMGVLQWTDAIQNRSVYRMTSDDEAWVKIWEIPRPGCRYLVSIDPMTGVAHGDDPDNHGVGVWRDGYWGNDGRWVPPALVARLADVFAERREKRKRAICRWDIALLEGRVAMLAAYYGWATIVPELNLDRGLIELLKLRPRVILFQRVIANRTEQTEVKEYGWMTTTTTRGKIIENLKRLIRTWQEPGAGIMIWDPAVLGECQTMIVKDSGKEEAMSGCHDDQVLMAAIGMETIGSAKAMPYPQLGGRGFGSGQQPTGDMTYS